MTKLNLGCGFNKREGYLNVDREPNCIPDLVFDMEHPDWPWETSSVTQVIFHHSLEHVGQETRIFLRVIQELYRVCAPNAVVKINVPHPRHDSFMNDPTHVRAITPSILALFNRELNEMWTRDGASNTPLAFYLNVDFNITEARVIVSQRYRQLIADGALTPEEVEMLANDRNNVIEEYQMKLTVRKPSA